MIRTLFVVALLLVWLKGSALQAQDAPTQAELEKQFQERMTNVDLIGSFTVTGADGKPPEQDRYHIESVTKGKNDYWIFKARIQYGGRDAPFSMPLQVKWAGDTPVVTVTDVLVPGIGTFTARVLFYKDQYAGTWRGDDHGGQMYGRIVKHEEAKSESDASESDASESDASDSDASDSDAPESDKPE